MRFRRSKLKDRMLEDFDQAVQEHIERETLDNIERGMSPEEARYAAFRKFGNITRIKEQTREAWGFTWLEQLMQDIRYGVRTLRRAPGFTIVAVLTLALGIGANTAIFSVVQGVVLAPLPYRQPDRLVALYEKNYRASRMGVAYADFQDWRRDAHSFQRMALFKWRDYSLTNPGSPEHLNGKEVSAGFFSMLGVEPVLGRDFTQQEDQPGGAPAAIISDRIWRDRFGGGMGVLGKAMTLNGTLYTIVGVLPRDFHFLADSDIYTPIGQTDPVIIQSRTIHASAVVARLKPGVTMEQAHAELETIQQNLDNLYPAEERGLSTNLDPLKQRIVANVRGTLLMLFGAVGLVLLIACANVASLLLARSASRTREFAIRSALGASRSRLIRSLLTESILLSLCGGILGFLLANTTLRMALASARISLPRAESIELNGWVLLFTFGISIAVGVLFGLVPALKTESATQQNALKEKGRTATSSHRRAKQPDHGSNGNGAGVAHGGRPVVADNSPLVEYQSRL